MLIFRKIGTILVLLFVFQPGHALAVNKITVFVSILPQKYFVQQIGGKYVDVHVMVLPGASPATYEPKPRQMAALTRARIYFSVGVAFEHVWLKKFAAASPQMKVVATDQGIAKIPMASHHHPNQTSDQRREGEVNGHKGLDPHIWLSPPLVKVQARTIRSALQKGDPQHHADYEENYTDFVSRIDALDAKLRATFADKKGLRFMVYHPAWGYFAKTYKLEQIPIEMEGKRPKPEQLKKLIEHARQNQVKFIIVQPQFSAKSAALVAREIGAEVVVANPLAKEWMLNLQEVADTFKAALMKKK